jgi:hypothetical protein
MEIDSHVIQWSTLNDERHPILESVLRDWRQLLADEQLPEEVYHRYLFDHAGLFFGMSRHSYFAISKLRLGTDYVVDFVIPHTRGSDGALYELVEIERPSNAPFTKKGASSARLSTAVQQVLNWKRWLYEYPSQARHYLPSLEARGYNFTSYRFTIYIGTRQNTEAFVNQRNNYSKQLNIQIRSFDSLTDRLIGRTFSDISNWKDEDSDVRIPGLDKNQVENPFYKAFTDEVWRKAVRKLKMPGYATKNDYPFILSNREYNDHLAPFLKQLGSNAKRASTRSAAVRSDVGT